MEKNQMSENKKSTSKLILVLGVSGCIAGIFLLFSDSWFIGVFGSIASAGLAYKGFKELNTSKDQ